MAQKFRWIIWLQKWLARNGVKYYKPMISQTKVKEKKE